VEKKTKPQEIHDVRANRDYGMTVLKEKVIKQKKPVIKNSAPKKHQVSRFGLTSHGHRKRKNVVEDSTTKKQKTVDSDAQQIEDRNKWTFITHK